MKIWEQKESLSTDFLYGSALPYIKEYPRKNILNKIGKRIFERKAAKKCSKEYARKNIGKNIRKRIFNRKSTKNI